MNSSTNEENFLRLYKLVVCIGTKAVREKFDQIFPPSSLYSTLKTSETTLKRNIRIRPDQDALLFPSTGMPSSNAFDLTLMISLIRNINPPCPPPIQGYDELPSPTETSLAADLARIKWYRNLFSHAGKPEIDTSRYTNDWQVLSETIKRIGGPTYKVQCDILKNSHLTLDELNSLREELVITNRSIEQMCTLLDADKHKRLEADTKALIDVELSESTFVETEASRSALESLKTNGVVLISGGAGTGKSRMGLMVLHHFQLSNSSYRAIKLTTIDEWQTLDKRKEDQKFVVLLDDIFGETNCTFNKGRNEPILDQIYAYVQKEHVKVIITIRNTVKQHCTEIFETHRLFSFDLIDLNTPKYALQQMEKIDMLVRHFSRRREGVLFKDASLIDRNGIIFSWSQLDEIIHSDPVHGFPLTVYRFVNNKKFLDLGSKFFTSPTDKIKEEMTKIRREGNHNKTSRLQYAVLVYTALNGNSIDTRDGTLVNEINSIIDTVYGKKVCYKKCDVKDAIECVLKQMYLIKDPSKPCFHFSHITLQESVIVSFADTDESSINKIIPMLSLSFIIKIARSEDYNEKQGEVVLKVPQQCYRLLAERVVEVFLADGADFLLHENMKCFLSSELFDKVGNELLGLMVDSYFKTNTRSNDIFTSGKKDDKGICLPVLLLRQAAMIKEKTLTVVPFLLRKVINESMQSSSYCNIVLDCKAAIVDVVYKLCSRDSVPVKVVTDALQIANESNIHVSEDQFLHTFDMHQSTLYIYQCISESFSTFNLPLILHFSDKLKDETLQVNLFLKRMYADPRKRISLKSIEYLCKRVTFNDDVIEWMIKVSCERHWLHEVEYFFPLKGRTDAATDYIECFFKYKYCYTLKNASEECRTLFKFLLKQTYHNDESINLILKLINEQTMHCGNFLLDLVAVVDHGLLNFNTILSFGCAAADTETVNWVLDNIGLDNLDIKQALMTTVTDDRHGVYFWAFKHDARLDIVKRLLPLLNLKECHFKDVVNAVWDCENFKIIQYFLENVKCDTIDTKYIVTFAIELGKFDCLDWIIQNGVTLHLDFNMALIALCSSCWSPDLTKHKKLIEKLWQIVDNKAIFDQRKIVDEACKNENTKVFIWFLEVFDLKLIDINKMLTISYTRGDLEVVKYIVENVHHTSYVIDMNLFLENPISWPLNVRLMPSGNIHNSEMVTTFLLSKSGFTAESFRTLLNESIRRKHWDLVEVLLIYCGNNTGIFDIESIVQVFIKSGKLNLLSRMLINEETKHCIQFIDMEKVMMNISESRHLHELLPQIWTLRKERCDINSIIKKHCSDKGLSVDVLKWIVDNVDHDCIDLDYILQSCCRNVKTSFVKYMFSKVDKEKLDVKSAFLEACRSNAENSRPSKVLRPPLQAYTYNPSIDLIDFLLQHCGAGMCNISEGVNIALQQANYKLIYYFFANGLCKDIMIDMKSLLNSACRSGEYDLTVWIMQNIQHTDLDLSSAFINACMYQCVSIDKSSIFSYVDLDSVLYEPYYDDWDKETHDNKYTYGLWCAMYILDKINNTDSLDYETAISFARKNENERMVQWLQYIFKSGNKNLQHKKADRKLLQGTLTFNTQDINISPTATDMNSPTKFEDATALSIHSTSDTKTTNCTAPSTEMIKDNNEHFEPSDRNTTYSASSNQKRKLDNNATSNEERSSSTLKKCDIQ